MTKIGERTIDNRKTYKPHPIHLEQFLEACLTQQKMHWLHTEIDMVMDRIDFYGELSQHERNIVIQTLRFFTQSDVEVGRCYVDYYLRIFKSPEVRMMLLSFANIEGIHTFAYAFLMTALNLPDSDFQEFLEHKEMCDKYDYMQSFDIDNPQGIATTLAVVSGFIEGLSLYASFTILLYFSSKRKDISKNCLMGLGQIVSFSMRDETLHCLSIMKLFRVYVEENLHIINLSELEKEIKIQCRKIVEMEIAFINLIFKDGDLEGLTKDELISHIYYLGNLRLSQLGFSEIFEGKLIEWTRTFLYPPQLANFFESFETNYTKNNFSEMDQSNPWDNVFL